ncbi:hypothetical protein ACRQ1B_08565 [Rhizobium panacihumi]|uniref:hypothetical protein n=1 Tax=Rhizobium panacihumi TaxID=2008450 RepID=UPI003D79CF01
MAAKADVSGVSGVASDAVREGQGNGIKRLRKIRQAVVFASKFRSFFRDRKAEKTHRNTILLRNFASAWTISTPDSTKSTA